MDYPKYVIVNGIKYDINTDFRIAIKCQSVALDETISDYERPLAIIYLLFGEKGLKSKDRNKLLELGLKFLSCGNVVEKDDEEPDMDFIEDYDYIVASFMSDFNIDLDEAEMHWWKFSKLMNGLSNSEMGNCCVLNRIRNLRNFDVKDIKDKKEKDKIMKAKEQVALKRSKKENHLTKEQEESMKKLDKIIFGR